MRLCRTIWNGFWYVHIHFYRERHIMTLQTFHQKNESNWKWEMWNEIWKGLHQHLFMSNVFHAHSTNRFRVYLSLCECFLLLFFSFTFRTFSYPFVAEFVFDFYGLRSQKKREKIYLWGGKYMLSMNKSYFMSILCQNLLHCIIMLGAISFFFANQTN